MKFKQLIKLYESEQAGPPYTRRTRYGETIYYKDPEHKIMHRTEKDPRTGLTLPAYIRDDGTKWWMIDNELHRDEKDPRTGLSLPAVETSDGITSWWQNDQQHRLDGPAVELPNGTEQWYINGIELSPKEIEEQKQKIALNNRVKTSTDNPISGIIADLLNI